MRTWLAWLILAASVAHADIVWLKGGGKIEGKVRREKGKVIVETSRGTITVDESMVERIDQDHDTPPELYESKLAALKNSQQAQDYIDLALWANQNKLADVLPSLMRQAAPLCKSGQEALVTIEKARRNGLASSAEPLFHRAEELTRNSDDTSLLLSLAVAARSTGRSETAQLFFERMAAAASRGKDPRSTWELALHIKNLNAKGELDDVLSSLIASVGAQCASGAELRPFLQGVVDGGLKAHAPVLLARAATLLKDGADVPLLLDFASVCSKATFPEWSYAELQDRRAPFLNRIAELADQSENPREIVSWAGQIKKTGFDYAVDPLARRTALLCAGKDVKFIQDLIEQMRSLNLDDRTAPLHRKILEIDPKHEPARRALGYRFHQGQWISNDEWHLAQGHVRFEGSWMSPKERDLRVQERTADLWSRELQVRKQESELQESQRRFQREREEADRRLDEERRAVQKDRDEARKHLDEERRAAQKERDEARRQMDDERRALQEREQRLRDKESEMIWQTHCTPCGVWYKGSHVCIKQFSYCSSCSSYYNGTHICARSHDHCGPCGGYFSRPHSCRR